MFSLFRARQVYVRSDGQVRFVTLKPWHQAAVLVFGMASLFWIAHATINVAFKDQLLVIKERRLYETRLEYEDRIAELRRAIDRMNDKLLLDQGEYLERVEAVRADYEKLVERQRILGDFVRQGLLPAGKSVREPQPVGQKTAPKPARDSSRGIDFRQKYAGEFRYAEGALAPLAELRIMFQAYDEAEAALLDNIIERTSGQVSRARKVFRKLGIDDEAMVERSSFSAASMGGPFVTAAAMDFGSETVAERMTKVIDNLTTMEKLRFESARMPVWLPLREVVRVSSPYGIRTDPMRRVAAMHTGVDFMASYGAPVVTTASGKVVKAGWDGAYGRVVDVDHGFGVVTRYAHLKSLKVRAGQIIRRGTAVGLLGNTGRSTGSHLHYEIRVHSKPVNPVLFWKIRNDLQAVSN